MKKLFLNIFIILALLIIGSNILMPKEENQGHKVLDCSQGKCEYRFITYYLVDCEPWTTNCKKTKKGLKEIGLISGETNYVSAPFTDQKFTVELIDIELERPWDLEFLPDGSMLVTEQIGKIIYIKNNSSNIAYRLQPIAFSNSGLLGLAIDPDFSSNSYVYISYTYQLDNSDSAYINPGKWHRRKVFNKVSRLTFKNGILDDEVVLLDKIPGDFHHAGSRLEFGPDGKLYATTGQGNKRLPQEVSFLGGKILRLNPDGTVPKDNPFPGSYVYSMGHRNPQGLAWHPITKELYSSEHGPWRYDEINKILPGKNYGWGSYKCDEKNSDSIPPQGKVIFPIVCFKNWTIGPSGMEFVSDPENPWFGSLFVSSQHGKHLHRYVFDDDKVIKDEIFFVSKGKEYIPESVKGKISLKIRDVEYYDGSLYVIGKDKGLVKITPK